MADNVAITAGSGTSISTDDIGGVQVQRVKVQFGADGSASDVSATNPIPTYAPDGSGSGTISATDAVVAAPGGAGALLSGTPTASSYVALALTGGDSGFVIQATGTFGSGTVWFECSADSTNGVDGNWSTLSCRLLGTSGTTISDSTTTAGLFRGDAAGMTYLRARIKGATTPSVAVVIRTTEGVGPVALNAPLPTGTNTIGAISALPAGTALIGQTRAAPSATATRTDVTAAAADTSILASNSSRLGATIYNESAATCYLLLGSGTSSATNYTVQLTSQAYYEVPFAYTGAIRGFWAAATGTARVTELT